MKGWILVLMLNVCYLAIILIFLVVTWWLLLITWWLLLVTGSYCLLPLVAASSHFQYEHKIMPLMNTYISFVFMNGMFSWLNIFFMADAKIKEPVSFEPWGKKKLFSVQFWVKVVVSCASNHAGKLTCLCTCKSQIVQVSLISLASQGKGEVNHIGNIAKVSVRRETAAGSIFSTSDEMVEFLTNTFWA